MDNKKSIETEVLGLQQINDKHEDIEKKLDELMILLAESSLDSKSVKSIQQRFNNAVEYTVISQRQVKEFKKIDEISDTSSREELLDQFSVLLVNNRFNSQPKTTFAKKDRVSAVILFITGVAMTTLGYAMIVMPAPPYFEMFTVYYFTTDDGVTLMDLISLCIILAGAYLMIRSFYRTVSTTRNRNGNH